MKKILLKGFLLALVLILMGCETSVPTPLVIVFPTYTSIPTEAPTNTQTPTLTSSPTYTPTPTEIPVLFTPNYASYCRFGPNENIWAVMTTLAQGQPVTVIGKSDPVAWNAWWEVKTPKGECWVYSGLGSTTGDTNRIQEASAPFPAYTPVPTLLVIAKITIQNNQKVTVCEVDYKRFIVDVSYQKLDFTGPIQPGKSVQASIAEDMYLFRFLDCNGNLLGTSPITIIDYYNTTISTP